MDRGELSVSDMWVVLIKPARVSAEKAASLQAQAKRQAEINRLLVAVGDADNGTAEMVQAAAKDFGFALPGPNDPRSLHPTSGLARPADEVPNPMSLEGLIQQGIVRDNDMAQTVRESREWTTEDGQVRKTLLMMDGSRHEIYEWNEFLPCVEDTYYDKHGNEVSSTFSQDKTNYDGTKFTSIKFADGTEVTMTRTADGKCTGGVTAPDGRHGVLPDEFFSDPALTTVGGALTGLEEQAKRGIPMLTPVGGEPRKGRQIRRADTGGRDGAVRHGDGEDISGRLRCRHLGRHGRRGRLCERHIGGGSGYWTWHPRIRPTCSSGWRRVRRMDVRLCRRNHRQYRVPLMRLLPTANPPGCSSAPLGLWVSYWR